MNVTYKRLCRTKEDKAKKRVKNWFPPAVLANNEVLQFLLIFTFGISQHCLASGLKICIMWIKCNIAKKNKSKFKNDKEYWLLIPFN